MPVHQSQLAFNAGEVSPYLIHRTDFDKHQFASQTVENFLPLPFGGLRKRPGLRYLVSLPAACRLQHFSFSTATGYVLAFSTTGIRIYSAAGVLKDTVSKTFADPFSLQFAHVNDVLFIASPTEHPQRLTRNSDTDWTIEDLPWTYPPLLDDNDDEDWTVTATCTGDYADPGEDFTATSSANLWSSSHVGSWWMIGRKREAEEFEVKKNLHTNGLSAELLVQGIWTLETFGSWTGSLYLQRSKDDGSTWEDIRFWSVSNDRNLSASGEETTNVLLRIWYSGTAGAGTAIPSAVLTCQQSHIIGLAKVKTYSNPKQVTMTAQTQVRECTTDRWAEGAFSTVRGFPAAIVLHERRLMFAGTSTKPVSLWSSAVDDLLNFEVGTEDDDGIYVTLAATEQDPIRWLSSQRRLFVGTAGGEWVFGSETTDQPLTPANLLSRRYTNYGSAELPALTVNDGVFFLERQGRRVRELAYLVERETYDAADLTRLAEHITAGGIVQMAWQFNREPTLWCVRADGTLLAFAYVRPERVTAWTRHTTTGGLIESVTVLRNDSDDDSVYVVVNRSGARSLEVFATGQQAIQEAGTIASANYLDASITGTAPAGTMSGLSHLSGQAVEVLADGVWTTETVTSGGAIQLDANATTVIAGLPIASTLVGVPLDIQTNDGATHGRRKRGHELAIDLYQSYGGTVNLNGLASGKDIQLQLSTDLMAGAPTLFTGWKVEKLPPGYVEDLAVKITHSTPHPFTLRALVARWHLHEP